MKYRCFSYNIGAKEKKQQQQKTKEERKRIKKSPLAHVKPLNQNKNPSLIFFTERMITIIKTNFLNSGSASWLTSCVIFVIL